MLGAGTNIGPNTVLNKPKYYYEGVKLVKFLNTVHIKLRVLIPSFLYNRTLTNFVTDKILKHHLC